MNIVDVDFFESKLRILYDQEEVLNIVGEDTQFTATELARTFFNPEGSNNIFVLYLNIDKLTELEATMPGILERTVDHEIIHLTFFMLYFFGIPVIEGGENEVFAYLHNYLDKLITETVKNYK